MGFSTRSSNYALPTSRLVLWIKRVLYKKDAKKMPGPPSEDIPANQLEYSEETHGKLWNAARFLNRTAEAWFRQFIVMNHLLHGYVVIFDRHFFFDSAPVAAGQNEGTMPFSDRLFFWFINHWFPKPSLTIFLDAPVELLYRRKAEASLEYLEQQRGVYLVQGGRLANFIRVDASQPLEQVVAETTQHIDNFYFRSAHQRCTQSAKMSSGKTSPGKEISIKD